MLFLLLILEIEKASSQITMHAYKINTKLDTVMVPISECMVTCMVTKHKAEAQSIFTKHATLNYYIAEYLQIIIFTINCT